MSMLKVPGGVIKKRQKVVIFVNDVEEYRKLFMEDTPCTVIFADIKIVRGKEKLGKVTYA